MRASSPAAVRPPGPEPTTATRKPVCSAGGASGVMFCAAQSATKRSSQPMATGLPFLPRTQTPSHWTSCGQTRPVVAGSALSTRRISAALTKS